MLIPVSTKGRLTREDRSVQYIPYNEDIFRHSDFVWNMKYFFQIIGIVEDPFTIQNEFYLNILYFHIDLSEDQHGIFIIWSPFWTKIWSISPGIWTYISYYIQMIISHIISQS